MKCLFWQKKKEGDLLSQKDFESAFEEFVNQKSLDATSNKTDVSKSVRKNIWAL